MSDSPRSAPPGATPEFADLLESSEWVAAPSNGDRGLPRAGQIAGAVLPALVAATVALALWELSVRARDIKEYLVPAPTAVGRALLDDPSRFIEAGSVSLTHALGGLLIGTGAAFLLAVVMAHSRVLERALFPLAILVKVTPVVAVAPLFLIWFGFNAWPKLLVAGLITFFPMLVNAVTGLRTIDPSAYDFMLALDASKWQVFWKLRLPASLPYVLAALRISVPLSLIGAVVAEWFAADSGVGQIIVIANGDLDTPVLFAAVTMLALIGVTLTGAVAYIERRVLFWHESSSGV
ncbi:MAG TPA: ABC transporter permease [Dehalococcoidia bacterium]|nr:ABC transporter permease [Dehalococcoidia bacterium]